MHMRAEQVFVDPEGRTRGRGLLLSLLAVLALQGCAGSEGGPMSDAAEMDYSEAESVAEDGAGEALMMPSAPETNQLAMADPLEEAPANGAEGADASKVAAQLPGQESLPSDPSRRIIKDGTMTILVDDVAKGVGRIENVAAQAGGYVLETSTDYSHYQGRRATVRMAVPVDAFESTLQRIRGLAEKVDSEQASGVDVSQEYVDLQSQIANLEATQARVREFLDRAQSVEEALNVNARLTEIEGEIATRRGRLRYLAQRSAHSTITVELREPPSEVLPDPTPTPSPLPEWSARNTVSQAYTNLRVTTRGFATIAIWLGIAILPWALPMLLVIWWIRRQWKRRQRGNSLD
jgi:hypothetical protein